MMAEKYGGRMRYVLIVSNGGNDKAKAKKDLYAFWGISLKYLFSSPERAKFKVVRNSSCQSHCVSRNSLLCLFKLFVRKLLVLIL
jgi:hypothetical protein